MQTKKNTLFLFVLVLGFFALGYHYIKAQTANNSVNVKCTSGVSVCQGALASVYVSQGCPSGDPNCGGSGYRQDKNISLNSDSVTLDNIPDDQYAVSLTKSGYQSTPVLHDVVFNISNPRSVEKKFSLDVAIEEPPSPTTVSITSFTALPPSINSGQSSTLSWTTQNATTCSLDPGFGDVSVNGSKTISNITNTQTYNIFCRRNNEPLAFKSVTVTVGSGSSCDAGGMKVKIDQQKDLTSTLLRDAGWDPVAQVWRGKTFEEQMKVLRTSNIPVLYGTRNDATGFNDSTGVIAFNLNDPMSPTPNPVLSKFGCTQDAGYCGEGDSAGYAKTTFVALNKDLTVGIMRGYNGKSSIFTQYPLSGLLWSGSTPYAYRQHDMDKNSNYFVFEDSQGRTYYIAKGVYGHLATNGVIPTKVMDVGINKGKTMIDYRKINTDLPSTAPNFDSVGDEQNSANRYQNTSLTSIGNDDYIAEYFITPSGQPKDKVKIFDPDQSAPVATLDVPKEGGGLSSILVGDVAYLFSSRVDSTNKTLLSVYTFNTKTKALAYVNKVNFVAHTSETRGELGGSSPIVVNGKAGFLYVDFSVASLNGKVPVKVLLVDDIAQGVVKNVLDGNQLVSKDTAHVDYLVKDGVTYVYIGTGAVGEQQTFVWKLGSSTTSAGSCSPIVPPIVLPPGGGIPPACRPGDVFSTETGSLCPGGTGGVGTGRKLSCINLSSSFYCSYTGGSASGETGSPGESASLGGGTGLGSVNPNSNLTYTPPAAVCNTTVNTTSSTTGPSCTGQSVAITDPQFSNRNIYRNGSKYYTYDPNSYSILFASHSADVRSFELLSGMKEQYLGPWPVAYSPTTGFLGFSNESSYGPIYQDYTNGKDPFAPLATWVNGSGETYVTTPWGSNVKVTPPSNPGPNCTTTTHTKTDFKDRTCSQSGNSPLPGTYTGDRAILEDFIVKNNIDRNLMAVIYKTTYPNTIYSTSNLDLTKPYNVIFVGDILTELHFSQSITIKDGTMLPGLKGLKLLLLMDTRIVDPAAPKWTLSPNTTMMGKAQFPEWISQISSLEMLYLNGVYKKFYFAEPDFHTTLPSSIGNLRNLKLLALSENDQLTGSFPATISNLTNLEVLTFVRNGTLGGNVPDLTATTRLRLLSLEGPFIGTLNICSSQNGLQSVDIHNTQLSGFLNWLVPCIHLQTLDIPSGSFTGLLPAFSQQASQLFHIDLSGNKISGTVPPSWSNLPGVRSLNVSNTCLDATSVQNWCATKSLSGDNCKVSRVITGCP